MPLADKKEVEYNKKMLDYINVGTEDILSHLESIKNFHNQLAINIQFNN